MCGRYYIDDKDKRAETFEKAMKKEGFTYKAGDIYPNTVAPLISSEKIAAGYWGYPLRGKKDLINIRGETAPFNFCKNSFEKRRCALPCGGYYEWDKNKEKFLFRLNEPFYLGGVYLSDDIRRFAILTVGAIGINFQIHERMPVVLTENSLYAWLNDTEFALNYIGGIYDNYLPSASRTD